MADFRQFQLPPVAKLTYRGQELSLAEGQELQVRWREGLWGSKDAVLAVYGGWLSLSYQRTYRDPHFGQVSATDTVTFLRQSWEEAPVRLQVDAASSGQREKWVPAHVLFLNPEDQTTPQLVDDN